METATSARSAPCQRVRRRLPGLCLALAPNVLAPIVLAPIVLAPIVPAPLLAQQALPKPSVDRAALEDATVELVVSRSEHQAKVAARAMWSGFLVDMLLIPETTYHGRRPLSSLQPGLRGALEGARPGEPQLLVGGSDVFLVARLVPELPPSHLGAETYAQEPDEIWAVLSVGPTDPRLLSYEVDVETEDLAAICRSKSRHIEKEIDRARAALAALPSSAPPQARISAHADVISALSFLGELDEAIAVVGQLAEWLTASAPGGGAGHQEVTHRVLGILELRRGELENCLRHHHREMCLFPLSENAVHKLDDGAKKAFAHFESYLRSKPDDLEVRWLLNIAAMTLGRHPEGVPERFRIGPEALESAIDPGRMVDVAGSAGVSFSDNAGGSVADDFDGDGLLDLVVSSRDPCSPLRFYRNRGDGTFADESEAAGLAGQLGGLNITHADVDNDGRLDLYVMRGGWETAIRDSLLLNRQKDGQVFFEDVTARSGLGGPAHRTHSVAWADYDGDGWLDVFLGHELSFSRLMRNRGDGTFEDATDAAGVRLRSLTKGAAWGDIDGDLRPDLYVSNFGERNLLFRNLGGGRFEEIGRESGVDAPTYSFATWFWDMDNDGHQDLFVASFLQTVDEVAREYLDLPPRGETLRLYRGRGDGSFEDVTEASGMARVIPTMGANFGDLDNDGWLDLYLGTGAPSYGLLIPNRFLVNRPAGGGRRFVDVTTATGTGHLQKGHGVSFADFDHDGDQDVFANMGGAFPGDKYPSALFANPGHGHDWIAVELVGTHNNRAAIGARIRVTPENADVPSQRVRWVTAGGSFGSSPLRQHIGLGAGARSVRLEISWPAVAAAAVAAPATRPKGHVQVLDNVPVNRLVRIVEGEDGFEEVPLRRFDFSMDETHAH